MNQICMYHQSRKLLLLKEDDNEPPMQHRTQRQQLEDTREWISIRDAIMRMMWERRNHGTTRYFVTKYF
jgi:hypothetical protein